MRKPVPKSNEQTPHVVQPTAIYTRRQLSKALRISLDCIEAAVRSGELKVSERGNRYNFLGAWILDWIASGESGGRTRSRMVKPHGNGSPVTEDRQDDAQD